MKQLFRILNNDLSELIVASWRKTPLLYKQSFFIIFITLNIVFLYHTVNFVWGNHDWGYINNKLFVDTDFAYARFSLHVLKQFLTGGYILPVWTNMMSFLGLSLGAVLLCYYWKLPKKLFLYIVPPRVSLRGHK